MPRAGVVARGVPGRAERLDGHRRTTARVAVRDHLRALGGADERPDRVLVDSAEEFLHVEVTRAGKMPLTRITRVSSQSVELAPRPDVEQDQAILAETAGQLLSAGVAHSEATTVSSAATEGRSESRAIQSVRRGYGASDTPSRSRARISQGT